MTSIEDNKQVVLEYFAAIERGDIERVRDLARDCVTFHAGDMPISGYRTADEMASNPPGDIVRRNLATPLELRLGVLTAEDDRVCFEAESFAQLTDGRVYNNQYHFSVRVRDGRILEWKEYSDTLHVKSTFSGPEVDGPPQARRSNLSAVTRSFSLYAAANRPQG